MAQLLARDGSYFPDLGDYPYLVANYPPVFVSLVALGAAGVRALSRLPARARPRRDARRRRRAVRARAADPRPAPSRPPPPPLLFVLPWFTTTWAALARVDTLAIALSLAALGVALRHGPTRAAWPALAARVARVLHEAERAPRPGRRPPRPAPRARPPLRARDGRLRAAPRGAPGRARRGDGRRRLAPPRAVHRGGGLRAWAHGRVVPAVRGDRLAAPPDDRRGARPRAVRVRLARRGTRPPPLLRPEPRRALDDREGGRRAELLPRAVGGHDPARRVLAPRPRRGAAAPARVDARPSCSPPRPWPASRTRRSTGCRRRCAVRRTPRSS